MPRDQTPTVSETSTASGRAFVRLFNDEGKKRKRKTQQQHQHKSGTLRNNGSRFAVECFLAKTMFLTRQKRRRPRSCQPSQLPSRSSATRPCGFFFFFKVALDGLGLLLCARTNTHVYTHTHKHPGSIQPGAFTQMDYCDPQSNKEASNSRRIQLAAMLPTAASSLWGHSGPG